MSYSKYFSLRLCVFVGLLTCLLNPSHCQTLSGGNLSTPGFQNDICIPGTLYLLGNVQNDIFVEPLIKRWRPYDDVVRFSGTADYSRRLQRVASITLPIEATKVTLSLINQDEFRTIKTLSATVRVGNPGIGKDTITLSIIGDSFTHGAFFKEALLAKGYIPNLQMVGLREVRGFFGQFDEGRGGWRLNTYFTVTNQRTQAYNGYWQPQGDYRYWGATAFWQLVKQIQASPGDPWTFLEKYNTERFFTRSLLFDAKSGLKRNPVKNDMMYDNTSDQYVIYDGSRWQNSDYKDFTWEFDYGKYLSMWKLKKPMILAEFLGLNDFRDADPSRVDFTEWNFQMEKVVSSYLKAVPTGKFVIMIPSSTCGILDNKTGDFTTKQNASMWELRRNIIETFDNRTSEQIYIVDAGVAIDSQDGTRFLSDSIYTMPYQGYEGKERIAVQTGNPHPYPNYPTMGISLAAFIQYHRSKEVK